MGTIDTLTLKECTELLRHNGLSVSQETLGAGIEQGVYPFAVCVKAKKSRVFQIYTSLLMKWIEERSVQGNSNITTQKELNVS